MAKNISPRQPVSSVASWREDEAVARKHAAAAIARSLNHQINTAWMLLRTADRFPVYEEPHDRFVHSSARVLRHVESQLWMVDLDQADLVQLASSVEGLWFAIDALS